DGQYPPAAALSTALVHPFARARLRCISHRKSASAAAVFLRPHLAKPSLHLHFLERVDGCRHAIAEIAGLPVQPLARPTRVAAVRGSRPGGSIARRRRSARASAAQLAVDVGDVARAPPGVGKSRPLFAAIGPTTGGGE